MLPFTREQFFDVFASYNERVWPAQMVFVALALVMLGAVRMPRTPKLVGWALAFLWAWMGVAYHIVFFAPINPAAFIFGAAFLLQAALIADATHKTRLAFSVPRSTTRMLLGATLITYALIAYPLLGYAAGQRYPAMPTFGLPCPTTIFTLGLMTWTARPVAWSLLVIPLAWAIIGGSAAITLNVPEDWALPIAAVALLLMRLRPATHRTLNAAETAAR